MMHDAVLVALRRGVRALLGAAALAVACCAAAEEPDPFAGVVRPLVAEYCFACHDGATAKGDLDLERFATGAQAADARVVWERVAKRVGDGSMPPPREPEPNPDERNAIVTWVQSMPAQDVDCERIASEDSTSWYPGYVMSRRLNRFEYENTVRDLFGVPIPVADRFPADGAGGEGFDTDGGALFLSAIQLEQYLDAADFVVESALPDAGWYFEQARTADAAVADSAVVLAVRARLAARPRLILARPSETVAPREAALLSLGPFVERAWRRPPDADELGRLLSVFDEAFARGDGFEASLKRAYKAVLVSPYFLFMAEPEPGRQGDYPLGDFQLASRLSYFLWSTMPDAELLGLAREGRLQEPGAIERQVRRMLEDPKARALGDRFAAQWLGVSQFAQTTRPDPGRFPDFDAALASAMRAEPALFFARIVREDRSLLEVIDARYTYADERLAALYGMAGAAGPSLQLVEFDDPRRGGVLGMAAVLTQTSHALRTSPVLRGKWVLENLLGERVPPPPPGAGALPQDDVQPDGLSLRARMEAHRANPECASCHASMDPIGFGLENYDPIGRWRTEQAGQPVDAAGTLPSGESFDGPAALKGILMARKDEVVRNLARKMLGYALGRALTDYDGCVIDRCMARLQAEEYRASGLFVEIALSYPFRHRYSAET